MNKDRWKTMLQQNINSLAAFKVSFLKKDIIHFLVRNCSYYITQKIQQKTKNKKKQKKKQNKTENTYNHYLPSPLVLFKNPIKN